MRSAPESRLTPPRVVFLTIIPIAVLAALAVAIFGLHESVNARREQRADMDAIARIKAEVLAYWREAQLAQAEALASGTWFRGAATEVSIGRDARLRELLRQRLDAIRRLTESKAVLVASTSGRGLVSAGALLDLSPESRRDVVDVSTSGVPKIIARKGISSDEDLDVDVLVPVVGDRGLPAAVLLIRSDPARFLLPLIRSWPRSTKSGESIVIERRGGEAVFLSRPRLASEEILGSMSEPGAGLPVARAASGIEGAVEGVDYRGVPVFAAVRTVPGSPWSVVAKQDRAEALMGYKTVMGTVSGGATTLVLFAAAMLGFAYKAQGKSVFRSLYRAEHARRQALEESRITLESIGDAVVATDAEGRVRLMNPVAEELTGWGADEARGRDLGRVLTVADGLTGEPLRDPGSELWAGASDSARNDEAVLVARDGSKRPVAVSGALIRDRQGSVTGMVVVLRDQSVVLEAQRQSALLTAAIRSSVSEVYLVEPGTFKFRFFNEAALGKLGFTEEEMQRLTPLDIVPGLTAERLGETYASLGSRGNNRLRFESSNRRADGRTYPVEVALELFRHRGEEYVIATVQDISDRKRSEEASRRLSRALLASKRCNQILIRAKNERALLQEICQTVVEIGGYTMAWVGFAQDDEAKSVRTMASAGHVGSYICDANVSWADVTRGRGPFGKSIREQRPVVVRDIGNDPEFLPWRDTALAHGFASAASFPLIIDGRAIGTIGIYAAQPDAFDEAEVAMLQELASDTAFGLRSLRDRAERDRAQLALEGSESRYRQLIESAPVGIFQTSSEGRALFVNPAMARILGVGSPEEAVRHFGDLGTQVYSDPRRRIELVRELQVNGRVEDFEYEVQAADGRRVWLRASARVAARLPDGTFVIEGFANDITARKLAELESETRRLTLQAVADAVPVMISISDPERRPRPALGPVHRRGAELLILPGRVAAVRFCELVRPLWGAPVDRRYRDDRADLPGLRMSDVDAVRWRGQRSFVAGFGIAHRARRRQAGGPLPPRHHRAETPRAAAPPSTEDGGHGHARGRHLP